MSVRARTCGSVILSACSACCVRQSVFIKAHVTGRTGAVVLGRWWVHNRGFNTGKRTEWSPIRSVIIRVITKSRGPIC